MNRLPTPGSDEGEWGQILNNFLSVEHNTDGSLKKAADIANAVNNAASALSTAQSKYTKPGSGIPLADLSSGVQSSLSKADSALQLADIATKANNNAVVHITGDESIVGHKTFSGRVTVPSPLNNSDAATRVYVDSKLHTNSVPFSQSGDATLGSSGSWRSPVNGTISRVSLTSSTAPIGSNLTVQFYKNTTLLSTQSIVAGTTTDASAALSVSLAAGDKLSVSAVSVGSGTPATNIVAQFDYTYTS